MPKISVAPGVPALCAESAGDRPSMAPGDAWQPAPAWMDALGECLSQELPGGTQLPGMLQPMPPAPQLTGIHPRPGSGQTPHRKEQEDEEGTEGLALAAPVLAATSGELPKQLEAPRPISGLLAGAFQGAEPAQDPGLATAPAAPDLDGLPLPVGPEVRPQPAATPNDKAWAIGSQGAKPTQPTALAALPVQRTAAEPSPRVETVASAFPMNEQGGEDIVPVRLEATTGREAGSPEVSPAPAGQPPADEPLRANSPLDREEREVGRDTPAKIVPGEMPVVPAPDTELPRVLDVRIAREAGSQAVRLEGEQPALAGPDALTPRHLNVPAVPPVRPEASIPGAPPLAFAVRIVALSRPDYGAAPGLAGQASGEFQPVSSRATSGTTADSHLEFSPTAFAGGADRESTLPPTPVRSPETASIEVADIPRAAATVGARDASERVTPMSAPPSGRTAPRQINKERPTPSAIALPAPEPAAAGSSAVALREPHVEETPPPVKAAEVNGAPRLSVPQPARQMHFRLAETASGPAVQVDVRDQGGELRVAVRTADRDLSQSLREGLPELVQQLGQRGYETQVWRPAGSPGSLAEPGGLAATSQKTDSQGGARDEARSGGDQSNSAGGGGSSQQEDRRAWREKWQESLRETQET
jgi:hypothetical protein